MPQLRHLYQSILFHIIVLLGLLSISLAQANIGTPGGSPITLYKVIVNPGGQAVTGSSSPIVVTGLSNGTAYTFTVYAINAKGSSVASAVSNSVTPAASTAPNTVYFIHTDHLNTPRAIFNSSQQEVWRWSNADPYGANPPNEKPAGLGNFTFNLRFAGQYYDKESGLHYNRHRYYDPETARYMQSDPIGLQGGLNTYAYVGGNPLGLTDPDGLSPLDVAFFVADVAKLGVAVYTGVGIGAAAMDVGMSAIGVVVPIPGAGQALKVARAADHLADASHARSAVKQVCCFVAGTPVLTQDGNKPIETIQLGDLVLSKNTETGEVAYKPVTELFKKYREIYELRVLDQDGQTHLIETTDDHPFYVVGFGFVKTAELASGSLIETQSGKQVTVQSVVHTNRVEHTYNIEVADFHTYYATEVGALVHNVCDFPKRRPQNADDVTLPSERAARRRAFREHNVPTSQANNYTKKAVHGKNDNLKGRNGEPSEVIETRDVNGRAVNIIHHKHGHEFKDANNYELPHYHGTSTNHISY